jgi:putative glutamine amidotransferase
MASLAALQGRPCDGARSAAATGHLAVSGPPNLAVHGSKHERLWPDIQGYTREPMTPPLVLIPAYRLSPGRVTRWDSGAVAVPDPYVRAVSRAGATAVIVPPSIEDAPADVLPSFHGLLLIGGGDVAPSRYGAEDHPEQYGMDEARDSLEIALVEEARRIEMPVLAVCRGAQIVNAAHGGSLFQHLPEAEGLGEHAIPNAGGPTLHDVKLSPDGRIAGATHADVLSCSSHHHQGIDAVGKGLVAVGWSDDGLVEAVEGDQGWLVAVQWHPEHTAQSDPAQQALFDALAVRAAVFREERSL